MGLKDAFKGMFNGEDDYEENYNNEEYYDDGYDGQPAADNNQAADNNVSTSYEPSSNKGFSVGSKSDKVEIVMLKPVTINRATITGVADHLLNNRTVVLTLDAANKEQSQRMIDFLSGVTYSINGDIQKADIRTYVISPGSVVLSKEQAVEAAKAAEEEASADAFDGI